MVADPLPAPLPPPGQTPPGIKEQLRVIDEFIMTEFATIMPYPAALLLPFKVSWAPGR
jgi:hypothetical protein